MIETRSNIEGNYKAFIYYNNPQDAKDSLKVLEKKIFWIDRLSFVIHVKKINYLIDQY